MYMRPVGVATSVQVQGYNIYILYDVSAVISHHFTCAITELFSLLPASTKKSILMQASGEPLCLRVHHNITYTPVLWWLSQVHKHMLCEPCVCVWCTCVCSMNCYQSHDPSHDPSHAPTEGAPTVLIKCRVLLVTVKLFPETMQTFGVSLCSMNSKIILPLSPDHIFY